MLVLLVAVSWGRRNISVLYRHLDSRNQPHRSRFNNFLSVGRWESVIVLHKSNRNIFKNGRKLKTGGYGSGLLRRGRKKTYSIRKTKGRVKYTYVDAGWLEVSDLGNAKLSTADLQNEARRIVWDDLTDHLK